ncbi:lipocalin-like domain-containing protein [Fulvivirga ligni]|uniref:lipocalin-like domain-containing protein n=1 Tax=Fulvivirga ligni TaxID=2904246 RepID=UPI001F37C5C6|nr:lipocalin-like domain-containing protein [Fulvivirga ligni]UII22296.1 lipocalin-like domain-containing protein [Fulvivirga ligni]
MKITIPLFAVAAVLMCCTGNSEDKKTIKTSENSIKGTWKLLTGVTIEGQDSTSTDYTTDQEFIKMINDTHFSFVRHDVNQGKDSTTAAYVSGAGTYKLEGSTYKEHLQYCNFREWEGHDFTFDVQIKNDTLVQSGVEKSEELGVDRRIIETYVRL